MIKQYTTVAQSTIHELNTSVNNMIELFGWQPYGQLTKFNGQLIQVMVRWSDWNTSSTVSA